MIDQSTFHSSTGHASDGRTIATFVKAALDYHGPVPKIHNLVGDIREVISVEDESSLVSIQSRLDCIDEAQKVTCPTGRSMAAKRLKQLAKRMLLEPESASIAEIMARTEERHRAFQAEIIKARKSAGPIIDRLKRAAVSIIADLAASILASESADHDKLGIPYRASNRLLALNKQGNAIGETIGADYSGSTPKAQIRDHLPELIDFPVLTESECEFERNQADPLLCAGIDCEQEHN